MSIFPSWIEPLQFFPLLISHFCYETESDFSNFDAPTITTDFWLSSSFHFLVSAFSTSGRSQSRVLEHHFPVSSFPRRRKVLKIAFEFIQAKRMHARGVTTRLGGCPISWVVPKRSVNWWISDQNRNPNLLAYYIYRDFQFLGNKQTFFWLWFAIKMNLPAMLC